MNLNRAMSGPGLLVLAAWLAGGDASADCISSQVECNQVIVSSAPSYSTCCPGPYGYGYGCASYDIPAGTLSGRGGDGSASATMSDSFVVVGPVEGTPLEFTAQLTLWGYVDNRGCGRACCYAGGQARLFEGSSSPAQVSFNSCTTSLSTTIEVQIHRLSGERFRVTAYIAGGGIEGASASIYGSLRFSGLPEGASVVSCNGFLQDAPVPVARGSWGRVKTRYR
jgi:hypothetical protein